jgi:hypothetical protein
MVQRKKFDSPNVLYSSISCNNLEEELDMGVYMMPKISVETHFLAAVTFDC